MKQILLIKKRREDKACNLLQEMRTALNKARQVVIDKKKELADYHNWRIEQEQVLYQELVSNSLHTKELDMYKHKVHKLREGEENKKQSVEQARKARDHAIEKEKEAKDHYNQAVRNRRKIEEFNKMIDEQLRKDMERKSEKELEDIPHRKKMPFA